MEDAYVIGICLALDDAVSAGIAGIRQDLTALDGAIAGTAASLRQLATVAAATMVAANPGHAATPTPEPPARSDPPVYTPTPHAPPAASISVREAAPISPKAPGDISPAPTRPPPVSTTPTAAPARADPVIEALPAPIAPPALQLQPAAPAKGPPLPQIVTIPSTTPQPTALSPAAPTVTVMPSVSPSPAAPVAPPVPPLAAHMRHQPSALPELSRRPHAPIQAQPGHSSGSAASHLLHSTAPDQAMWSATSRAAAPAASSPIAAPPSDAPPPLSAAAPHAPQHTSAPTGGDVFLDGTRMGHWLATHLAREAGRPQAGSTAFDPRLGIVWPGTQQGGG